MPARDVPDRGRLRTWEEIEDAIAHQTELRLSAEMIDVNLASAQAREFAEDAVRLICTVLGGQAVYVPRVTRYHRMSRNEMIRLNFDGDCKAAATKTRLSVRQVRNIVYKKK